MTEEQRLRQWIADLQSGMYINCVYCGHRYGPEDEVPATMADVLKEHIEQCPAHPCSQLKQEIERLRPDAALGALVRGMPKGVSLTYLDNGCWRIERVSWPPYEIQATPEEALRALGKEGEDE